MKHLVIILVFVLSGCASTLNERNAHHYANAGVAAQQAGDWEMARRHWSRAAVNAQLAGMTDKQQAIAFYEYGRSCGATCFFDESEKYLLMSLELDKSGGGPIHMSLLELARLNFDQKKYKEANRYFEQLPALYEKEKAAEKDPAGVALAYKEFSISLENTGRVKEAEKYSKISEQLEKIVKGNESNTERTPYGSCIPPLNSE